MFSIYILLLAFGILAGVFGMAGNMLLFTLFLLGMLLILIAGLLVQIRNKI